MRKITALEIQNMIKDQIQENLRVVAGTGKNKKIIISPDFKIIHTESGLTYTVDKVFVKNKKPYIAAHSGDGNQIVIGPSEFKKYEGL